MAGKAAAIVLLPDEEKKLRRRLWAERTERHMAQRCQLVLWWPKANQAASPGAFSLYPTHASWLNQVEI